MLIVASIIFTSCDVDVRDVWLNREAVTLVLNENFELTATVNGPSNPNLVWTSNNPSVAIVDENGLITAISEGTATISVVVNRSHTAYCVVTIVDGVRIQNVIWATRNVDAPGTFAQSPGSFGMFFQWNRLQDWFTIGEITDWDSSTPIGTT